MQYTLKNSWAVTFSVHVYVVSFVIWFACIMFFCTDESKTHPQIV